MATGLQVIGHLAPLLGLLPSTLERQLRAQRLAGQLPTGRPGGGRFSAHFEAHHLVNVILGLAGPEPSDAPAAAEALRAMPLWDDAERPDHVEAPLPTLEDQLANWLAAIAGACLHGGRAPRIIEASFASWEMSLCLYPRQAVIVPDSAKPRRVIRYAIEAAPFALRRVTVLHGRLMLAAGNLLTDTIKAISSQPAMAGAEQDNAGNLRQEAPAPFSDQSRANETDRSSNTPDGIHVEREFQARPGTLTETGSDDRCQSTPMLMMT